MSLRLFPRLLAITLLTVAIGWTRGAEAVPSFSRQTGEPCTSCHIGAFGPELTARGRNFKLLGYSDQRADATNDWREQLQRFSGMVIGSYNHTSGGVSPPQRWFSPNDNLAIDQASLFYAGRIAEHLGAFVQITEDGIGRRFQVDNVDFRYGRALDIAGTDVIAGMSFNNNPTVTDPYQTLPVWGQPFVSSALAPAPMASAILNGGLSGQVYGGNAYFRAGGLLYVEGGLYQTISRHTRLLLGADTTPTSLSSPALYGRIALQQESSRRLLEIGLFGIQTSLRPSGTSSDHFNDWGVDASFQWLGDRTHIVTAYGRWLREYQALGGTYATGGSANIHNTLTEARVNVSYWYQQTYGITGGVYRMYGSPDAVLYQPSPVGGSVSSRPNTQGYLAELAWVPFGKEGSFGAPWLNLRVGLQFTAYSRFNGGVQNYDGYGRNASNNNAVFLYTWLAF